MARACSLKVYSLGVADVLSDASWEPAHRDLDVLEVWSGVASVQRAALARGLKAEAFDYIHGPHQDLVTEVGFRNVLKLVMRLRSGPRWALFA